MQQCNFDILLSAIYIVTTIIPLLESNMTNYIRLWYTKWYCRDFLTCPSVSWHCISLHFPHHLVFHFATLSNFLQDRKFLPLDVLPLYKKVSNLQECEGLHGDLGEPRGGQKIPADVARASANRAAASAGGGRGWAPEREHKRKRWPLGARQ